MIYLLIMASDVVEQEIEKPVPVPLKWFTGFGATSTGIRSVRVNENFTDLSAGQVGMQFGQWAHYYCNPPYPDDPPEQKARVEEIMNNADVFIFEVTGHHPEEVFLKQESLREQYRGKYEAPFEFELFDSKFHS